MSNHYVYILASKLHGTLYAGATDDLVRRVYEHRNNLIEGFTSKYGIHTLVYYEICENRESANQRERQIKEWKRQWKIELIEKANPYWEDLYEQIIRAA